MSSHVMSSPLDMEGPQHVANRVLRRAQVAKMTRALQDRLALANVKIKHGWQNRSIDSIEPEIERELKRKRTDSSADMISDTSSNVSVHCFSSGAPLSSPLTAPIFSDDVDRSGSSGDSIKRTKNNITLPQPIARSQSRNNGRPAKASASWKSTYNLPESSPISYRNRSRPTLTEMANDANVSESSTVLNSPSVSEDDDQDLPLEPVLPSTPQITSSPPRTPSPKRPQFNTKDSSMEETHAGKEGADLLLYLAASPSPAVRNNKNEEYPPSTPPAKSTPLPSSMMSTPGFFSSMFNPTTPSTAFNFSDFVNITPSPAQIPWSRTPAAAKTPRAALEARRRLNFDGLFPSSGDSPKIGSGKVTNTKKGAGLGMELGGELVNS